ncbi:thiol reductant ABC exporter subunit CydC [Halomonas sp. PR-M31]|uniref:thiol reductant ABC exporter subunit CydC n=1 Tax=Halomonas sp. PR-M31 TaxID=1471202 RepID=UPI000AE2223A|nr:thiol reductant ABC exporter subunit CydC [Halomonas sp. PR-M31]
MMKPDNESSLISDFAPWLRQLKRRQGRLWLGALLMLLTLMAAIGLLALSGWFITTTAIAGSLLAMGAAVSVDIYRPGGGIRFFAVTRTAARYGERLYNHDTVLRLLADLRAGLFAVLTQLDGRSLGRLRAAEWLNRLTADIDTLDSLYLRLLAPPLASLLAVCGIALLLWFFAPSVAVPVLIALLLTWLWLVLGQAHLGMAASRRRVAALDRLRSLTIEQLQGLAELRCYGTLGMHRQSLFAQEQALYRDQRRLGRLQALGNAVVGLGVSLTVVLALWLGAGLYTANTLSGPLLVLMPLAVLAANEALALLPPAFTQLGATRAAAQRLNRLVASRSDIQETEQPVALAKRAPKVVFENVSLRYSNASRFDGDHEISATQSLLASALDDVSFSIEPGERVVLVGASGSGKSSVAQLLVRLIDPSSGRVCLDDHDVRKLSLSNLRQRIGYLTQQTELFHASLATNLRIGNLQADDDMLWEMLEVVDLQDWARELPLGLDTWVGESGRQLSGGQARRVALARVLLTQADMMILDEPFAGLDEATIKRIARRLNARLKNRTVLYLNHDQRHLPDVSRILSLRAGQLI